MKSIRILLVGALALSATALGSPDAAAWLEPRSSRTGLGVMLQQLSEMLRSAAALGVHGGAGQPIDLTSNACGGLKVTTLSTCQIAPNSTCLASCDPSSLACTAYDACAAGCADEATEPCKLGCNPACKFACVSDDAFDAVTACDSLCGAACSATCAAKVQAGEVSAGDCDAACAQTCSSECEAAAGVSGVENCGVQCGAACDAECSAVANLDCQIDCQSALYPSLTQACADACATSVWLFCDGERVQAPDVNACIAALLAAGVPVAQ